MLSFWSADLTQKNPLCQDLLVANQGKAKLRRKKHTMKTKQILSLALIALVSLILAGCQSPFKPRTAKAPAPPKSAQAKAPAQVQSTSQVIAQKPASPRLQIVTPGAPASSNVGTSKTPIVIGQRSADSYSVMFLNRSGKSASLMLNHEGGKPVELLDKENQVVRIDRSHDQLVYLITTSDGDISGEVIFGTQQFHEITISPKPAPKP